MISDFNDNSSIETDIVDRYRLVGQYCLVNCDAYPSAVIFALFPSQAVNSEQKSILSIDMLLISTLL